MKKILTIFFVFVALTSQSQKNEVINFWNRTTSAKLTGHTIVSLLIRIFSHKCTNNLFFYLVKSTKFNN
jgi:hypothetical protein